MVEKGGRGEREGRREREREKGREGKREKGRKSHLYGMQQCLLCPCLQVRDVFKDKWIGSRNLSLDPVIHCSNECLVN